MLKLTIKALTTDAAIQEIPYLDMRAHAVEIRDMAAAVLAEQGDQTVLEYHDVDGVDVLWSPEWMYAYVNKGGSGTGDSYLVESAEAETPRAAVDIWEDANAAPVAEPVAVEGLTPLQLAFMAFAIELSKAQILRDMADGVVPSTVDNFGDLHNHVDANTYGMLCDIPQEVADLIFPRGVLDDPDTYGSAGMMDAGNDIQSAVGRWLAERSKT